MKNPLKQTKIVMLFPYMGQNNLSKNITRHKYLYLNYNKCTNNLNDSNIYHETYDEESVNELTCKQRAYIQQIMDNVKSYQYEIVIVDAPIFLREYFSKERIHYTVFYPSRELRSYYLSKLKELDVSSEKIQSFKINYKYIVTSIDDDEFPQKVHIEMDLNENMLDLVDNIII